MDMLNLQVFVDLVQHIVNFVKVQQTVPHAVMDIMNMMEIVCEIALKDITKISLMEIVTHVKALV